MNIVIGKPIKIVALGAEKDMHLSHANFGAAGAVRLIGRYNGLGEAQLVHDKGKNKIAIECLGAEQGSFLANAYGVVFLQNGILGEGELWQIHNLNNNRIAFEALGAEKGLYLSHANNSVGLEGLNGEGEHWFYIAI